MDEYRKSFVATSKKFFVELRKNPESMKKTIDELGFDLKFHWNESNGVFITNAFMLGKKEAQSINICEISKTPFDIDTVVILGEKTSFMVNDALITETMQPVFSFMKDAIRINQIDNTQN